MITKKQILKSLNRIEVMHQEILAPISKEKAIERIREKSFSMQWIDCKNSKEILKKINFLEFYISGTFSVFIFSSGNSIIKYSKKVFCHTNDTFCFCFDFSETDNIIIINPQCSNNKYWADELKNRFDKHNYEIKFEGKRHQNIFILSEPYKKLLKKMSDSCMGRIESLNWE